MATYLKNHFRGFPADIREKIKEALLSEDGDLREKIQKIYDEM